MSVRCQKGDPVLDDFLDEGPAGLGLDLPSHPNVPVFCHEGTERIIAASVNEDHESEIRVNHLEDQVHNRPEKLRMLLDRNDLAADLVEDEQDLVHPDDG